MRGDDEKSKFDRHLIGEDAESIFCSFVINSLPIAVLTVDSELRITEFNPWAEHLTGYKKDEAIGKYCGEVLRGQMCDSECPLKTVIKREGSIVRMETTIQNKWGEIIPVRLSSASLHTSQGQLIGGLEAFEDISQLKELERQKEAFVSMFAHDIKSSLVIIGGFVIRLLTKGMSISREEHEKYLQIMKKEADKLEFMITDFLEYSRLQTGRLKLNTGATSIDKMLTELSLAYQAKSIQKGIELKVRIEDILPIIEADANRLERVFRNLIDNAFKFSEEGYAIEIVARPSNDEVIVKIIDQGKGIDAKDLPYVFDAFYRGQKLRKSEGFGLGLATVKAIVEAHGGRVHAESQVGKGSVFTVVLPCVAGIDEAPGHLT